jgi:SAM-dependent methyltransferase
MACREDAHMQRKYAVMTNVDTALQSRLDSERAFHDKRYEDGESRTDQLKYYWAIDRGAHRFGDKIRSAAVDADVLEYGCGLYSQAGAFGPISKSFQAIDISDAAVRRLRAEHTAPNVKFDVMDAMNMTFADNSFDVVYGSGIVHHLDVEACAREVSRVLRPGGSAIFWEPLGYNPVINAYRWLTPSARTPDEHPLLRRDFDVLKKTFRTFDLDLFGLTSIAAVPLKDTSFGPAVRTVLSKVDDALFTLPGIKYLAWYSIIHCTK